MKCTIHQWHCRLADNKNTLAPHCIFFLRNKILINTLLESWRDTQQRGPNLAEDTDGVSEKVKAANDLVQLSQEGANVVALKGVGQLRT